MLRASSVLRAKSAEFCSVSATAIVDVQIITMAIFFMRNFIGVSILY